MENQPLSLNRNSLITALWVGLALIALSIVYYAFDVPPQGVWNYLSYVILLVGIIYGTLNLRNKYRNGAISYGDSFLSGLLIGTYSGIISAVYTFLFYKYFAPEQIGKMLEIAEEQMIERSPNLTEEQLDMALEMTEKFMTPTMLAITVFFSLVLVSLIFSLITSIFIKKEGNPFTESEAQAE